MQTKTITAEVISIGDEITGGAILDTNAQWLSQELGLLGVRVFYHTTVGDDLDAMVGVFTTAVKRTDLVIVTGGLGPTEDDLTRQAAAKLLGVPLEQDDASLEYIKAMFARRHREMPDSNIIQSFFPRGASIIVNPNGTAPGFALEGSRTSWNLSGNFLMLTFPGVPAELKEMWNASARNTVHDWLVRQGGARHKLRSHCIHCFGAGESAIEAALPHLINRDAIPRVGITAKQGVITLRIFAEGDSDEECQEQIDRISKIIYEKVGQYVFGEEEDTLPGVVSREMKKYGKRVGTLEWGTRGLLAGCLAADCFGGGRIFSADTPFEPENLPSECDEFQNDNNVDYILIVGPYPKAGSGNPSDDNVIIAVYNRADNTITEDSYCLGGHPSIADTVFCNRVLKLLLNSIRQEG